MTTEDSETLSLPSLAIVTILGYLLYRYFFPSSSPSTTSPSGSPSSNTPVTSPSGIRYRFTPAQVEAVAAVLPQLSRRDIMWDLQRNGGSVQATTDRVLGGRALDVAPPSFQPVLPSIQPTPTDARSGGMTGLLRGVTGTTKKEEMDLITRYNLQGRVKSSDKGKGKEVVEGQTQGQELNETKEGSVGGMNTSGGANASGWATTKDARQGILQKRRDEMILEARRKMMERDAAGGGSGSGSGNGR